MTATIHILHPHGTNDNPKPELVQQEAEQACVSFVPFREIQDMKDAFESLLSASRDYEGRYSKEETINAHRAIIDVLKAEME